tara:strand:+ start:58 stop:396 length:339 start_codon:yes stop_codon:yes gene_type:complete
MKKNLIMIAVFLFIISLWFLNLQFPKQMTYECGSGDNKEIVVRESDNLIKNKTTGRNSYNLDFDRQDEDNFIVYMLWQSITGEGYMYKVDTNELGQLEPKQLCVYVGSKRYF